MLARTPGEMRSLLRRLGFSGPYERNSGRLIRFLLLAVFLSAIVSIGIGRAYADEGGDESEDGPETPAAADDDSMSPKEVTKGTVKEPGDDGIGANFRAGFNYGQGPVQDRPLAPFEAFPFYLIDDSLFFSDLRFFPTIDARFGGNAGFGYRYYSKGLDRVFGASGWYDGDGTRDLFFQQFGVSLETYGKWVDWRSNVYVPFGTTFQQNSATAVSGSAHFLGDNVAFDQMRNYYAAMKGFDMEAGVLIPGEFAAEHGIRAYAGGYYYADDQKDTIVGASARLQANIVSGLDASVQVTNDSYFNTRAFVGISWTFGPLHRSQLSQATSRGRLGEHITRNYTVLAPQVSHLDAGVLAIDPTTKTPYTIAHVASSAAPGGNGTNTSPFQTIADAQAAHRDIIFVDAGSVFHGGAATIVMNPGERIMGDGTSAQNYLAVAGVGSVLLPHGLTSGNLPVLDSATGNGVSLASNTQLANLTITNSLANGIYGNGLSGLVVQNVNVDNAGVDGIHLLNSTGNIALTNTSITNSNGNGFVIDGGTASVTFDGQVAGTLGHDLFVTNTASGLVDLRNAKFNSAGSQGLLLQNNTGNVTFKNLSLANSAGTGVDVEGESGTVQFLGSTTVSGAAGPSVVVGALASTGVVTFNNISIDHRQDAGLVVNNSSGAVNITGTTTVTNELNSGASAVGVYNSAGTTTFAGTVNVANSTGGPGVNLQNNTGTTSFATLNVSSVNGTALYANTGGTLVVNSAATTGDGGSIQATNGTAVDIENTTMNINLTNVSSANATVGLKLVTAPGTFAVFGNNTETVGSGGTITGAGTGILLQNVGTVGLVSMALNANTVGVQAQNVSYLALTNAQITNSATYGIDLRDTNSFALAQSTLSGNGAANIRAQFDTVASNAYTLTSNTLVSATGDNFVVQSLSGSEGSTLNLIATANAIQNTQTGSNGFNLNWNGSLSGSINQNAFVSNGASDVGVRVNNLSTTDLSTVSITNNTYAGVGTNDTGFQVLSAGPSQVTVSGNQIGFGATGGIGTRFSLGPSNTVNIANNAIVDTTDGATGILFDSVTGPGAITINNNAIQLANSGALLDRGIIFSSVTDATIGSVTYYPSLAGTNDNQIQGADTPFFAPSGSLTGGIFVNSVAVP